MNQFKVLLVDDSPQILKSLERMLKSGGYDIFTADSVQNALEILQNNEIDLVVTDESMPGLSGTDLLGVLKAAHPDIIRIMLTGANDVGVLKNAINKGEIYRFFTKPWDDFELTMAIRQGLQHRLLERENACLKKVASRQEKILNKLEEDYPGIGKKKLSEDGSIIIEE